MNNGNPFVIVSTPGMHKMAARVTRRLAKEHDLEIGHVKVKITRFKNKEVLARIEETVRRQHVFFFHGLQYPSPNDAYMTMLITNDALMRASVSGITLVVPYMAYLRQDRKDRPRVPITASGIAKLIESNPKVQHIITMDMHAEQEQGFYGIPVDNLTSTSLFVNHIRRQLGDTISNAVVISPDFGGAVRSRRFAEKLGLAVGIFEKSRSRANVSHTRPHIIGEPVAGKTALIFDDMIDTGGTIHGVMKELRTQGAQEVFVYATHGIFSRKAIEMFRESNFVVHCTDSIPRSPAFLRANSSWLVQVPIDKLLAEAVYEATLTGGSISKLSL